MANLQKYYPVYIGVAVVATIVAGYFFYQYQKSQQAIQGIQADPNSVQKAAQEEVGKLVAEVSKLIELPQEEEPTVATVTDIEKLKDQPFFQRAKNGDKVLIYTNAKKAILYSPSSKKVIEVAPVNIGTPSAQQDQSRIVLRNGTTTVGLTSKVEVDIKKTLPQANIVIKENASKSDYEKTLVILLNDRGKEMAESLAKTFGVGVQKDLPQDENKPKEVDIVVILGKDRT